MKIIGPKAYIHLDRLRNNLNIIKQGNGYNYTIIPKNISTEGLQNNLSGKDISDIAVGENHTIILNHVGLKLARGSQQFKIFSAYIIN